jgi:hypothetical protein
MNNRAIHYGSTGQRPPCGAIIYPTENNITSNWSKVTCRHCLKSQPETMAQSDNAKKEEPERPNWPCEWEGCLNDVKYQIDLGIDDMKPWICDEHMNKLVEIFDDGEE